MDWYKIQIEQAHEALATINSKWLEWYADNGRNPLDNITNAYCGMTEIDGFGYIMKDNVTEQYITGEFEVVTGLPIVENETENEL